MTNETPPWSRTEKDYLNLTSSNPYFVAEEYDNTSVIFDMINKGFLVLDKTKNNRHDGMITSLHIRITPTGRAALAQGGKDE